MTEFDSRRSLQRRDLFLVAIQQAIDEHSRAAERQLVDFLHGLVEPVASGMWRCSQGWG